MASKNNTDELPHFNSSEQKMNAFIIKCPELHELTLNPIYIYYQQM